MHSNCADEFDDEIRFSLAPEFLDRALPRIPIPSVLRTEWMRVVTSEAFKVLFFLTAETLGEDRQEVTLTDDEIITGVGVDCETPTILKEIVASLIEQGAIRVTPVPGAEHANTYHLLIWDVDHLRAWRAERGL